MNLKDLRNNLWKAATPEQKETALFDLIEELVEQVRYLKVEVETLKR